LSHSGNITFVEHVGEHFRVDVRSAPDRVVLELHGELDLLGTPTLEKAVERVEEGAPAIVVLDLSDLQFIDSAGLRVILTAHEHAQQHDWDLALTHGSEQVQRLFAIAGVGDHLRIVDSPDELLV
jgi:anti-anti-sigma factor